MAIEYNYLVFDRWVESEQPLQELGDKQTSGGGRVGDDRWGWFAESRNVSLASECGSGVIAVCFGGDVRRDNLLGADQAGQSGPGDDDAAVNSDDETVAGPDLDASVEERDQIAVGDSRQHTAAAVIVGTGEQGVAAPQLFGDIQFSDVAVQRNDLSAETDLVGMGLLDFDLLATDVRDAASVNAGHIGVFDSLMVDDCDRSDAESDELFEYGRTGPAEANDCDVETVENGLSVSTESADLPVEDRWISTAGVGEVKFERFWSYESDEIEIIFAVECVKHGHAIDSDCGLRPWSSRGFRTCANLLNKGEPCGAGVNCFGSRPY